MENKNFSHFHKSIYRLLTATFIFTILIGCSKDNSPISENEYDYLVKSEKLNSLSKAFISTTFTIAATNFPEIIPLRDSTNYSVDIYRIEYKTNYKGESIIASGVVAIPDALEGFPILSMQNGTNTAHNKAPSESVVLDQNFMLMAGMAGNGYILIMPDYIGFGSSEEIVHPYFVKEPTLDAVIDLIMAVREYLDNYSETASYNGKYFLAGYSQGGYATLAALSAIENDPEINISVTAASCGAGAYDLKTATQEILMMDEYPSPQYLPYYIYSHIEFGSLEGPLTDYFDEPYATVIPELFDGSYTNTEVNEELNNDLSVLLNDDFISGFGETSPYLQIAEEMEANSIDAWRVNSLIRFYHGEADLNVPSSQSEQMYNSFLALGVEEKVEYLPLPELTHTTGIYPWGIETVKWFNQLH